MGLWILAHGTPMGFDAGQWIDHGLPMGFHLEPGAWVTHVSPIGLQYYPRVTHGYSRWYIVLHPWVYCRPFMGCLWVFHGSSKRLPGSAMDLPWL